MDGEELRQHLVETPGRPRDVEHRIRLTPVGADVERPVERCDAGEGDPVLGILDEEPPQHLRLVGDAGSHHRIVDVADDDTADWARRDEHLRLRPHGGLGLQDQFDGVPALIARRSLGGTEMDAEIAVAVGLHLRLRAAEPRGDRGPFQRPACDPPRDVPEFRPQAVVARHPVRVRLPEDASDQEDLGRRAVAAIGLDHEAAAPLRPADRTGHELQRPDRPLPQTPQCDTHHRPPIPSARMAQRRDRRIGALTRVRPARLRSREARPSAGAGRAPWPSCARRGRGCRSASSRCRHGRAVPARSRRSAPLCSRWLAKAWRSTCGLTRSARDAGGVGRRPSGRGRRPAG